MPLSPESVLQRIPELIVALDGANAVRIHHDLRVFDMDQHALAILDVFHTPTSVQDGLARLAPRLRGRRSAEEMLSTIASMVGAGILVDAVRPGFSDLMFPTGGYGLAYMNIAMLEDPVRKPTFIQAIQEVVTPDDVVLDLGTGLGVLAIAAAAAGARKVYAVEPARSGSLAALLAERSDFGKVIEVVQGWSSTTCLPEPATVLTTDLIGNDALDMYIWEALQDARDRLLIPGARLIPNRLQAYAYLVEIPGDELARHRVTPNHVARWKGRFGIDFQPMLEVDSRRVAGFFERPEIVQKWERLSEPTPLYAVDLSSSVRNFGNQVILEATRGGRVNGVIVYFVARLSPGVSLSTAPWKGGPLSHWYSAGWGFPEQMEVSSGDQVPLCFEYLGDGRSVVQLGAREDVPVCS